MSYLLFFFFPYEFWFVPTFNILNSMSSVNFRVLILMTRNQLRMQERKGTLTCLRLFLNLFMQFLKIYFLLTLNYVCRCMQIASLSDKLENKAILLNHFSSRYTAEVSYYLPITSVISTELLWFYMTFVLFFMSIHCCYYC